MNPIRCLAIIPALFLLLGSGNMPRTPAAPDRATVSSGESVLIDVLANDGALGTGLQLVRLSAGSAQGAGSASIQDGQVLFQAGEVETDVRVRFGYLVQSAEGARALGEVIVTIQAPLPAVDIAGWVVGAGAGCDVNIQVGSDTVGTCTDANGRFEASLASRPADSVVSIRAALPAASGRVETWRSQPFTLASLVAAADAAGSVDEQAFAPLRLTPFSTVFSVQMERLNGGTEAASVGDIEWLESFSDVGEVFQFGWHYHGLTDGVLELPDGFADAHELLLDRPAFVQFTRDLDFSQANLAFETTLANHELLAAFPAGFAVAEWDPSSTLVPGTIEVLRSRQHAISLRSNGSGNLFWFQPAAATAMDWQFDEGRIALQGAPARSTSRTFLIDCPDGGFIQGAVASETRPEAVVRLVAGHARDLLGVRQTDVLVGDPPVVDEDCTLLNFDGEDRLSFGLEAFPAPAINAVPQGAWYFDLPTPGWQGGVPFSPGVARIDFDSLTLTGDGYLPEFQVSTTSKGRLLIELQETPAGGGRSVRLELSRQASDGFDGEEWTYRIRSQDGVSAVLGALAVKAGAVGFASAADARGLWQGGASVSTAGTSRQRDQWLFVDIPESPDDAGERITTFLGFDPSTAPFSWSVDNGVFQSETFRILPDSPVVPPGQFLFANCPPGAACYVSERRTWRLVGDVELVDGSRRIHVVEQLFQVNPDSPFEPVLVAERVNFYDEVDELASPQQHQPPAAEAAAKPRAQTQVAPVRPTRPAAGIQAREFRR